MCYVDNTWTGENPRFEKDFWCRHGVDGSRCNNDVEAMHGVFKKIVKSAHPNIKKVGMNFHLQFNSSRIFPL